jgi:hypothetical protein
MNNLQNTVTKKFEGLKLVLTHVPTSGLKNNTHCKMYRPYVGMYARTNIRPKK